MPDQITLPNDPAEALVKIAEFIDAIKLSGHEYPPGIDKRACEGWWQPVHFFYHLQGIAHEARLVSGQYSVPSSRIEPMFNSIPEKLCSESSSILKWIFKEALIWRGKSEKKCS